MIGSSKSVWGFDPRSVPGCQLWLDGADATTVTGTTTVTQWRDKSGNARHLGVGSGTTSYSSNAIQLASSYMFVTSPVDLSKVTVFIVAKTPGGYNHTVFIGRPNTAADYDSLDGFGFFMDGQTAIRFYGQSANISTFSVNTSTPQLFSFQSSGTSISGWLNGTSQSGGTLSSSRTSTAQGFAIGASWYGTFYGNIVANALLYEILVYNSALTTSQRQQVEGYLAHKWGLQTSIPSTHPFYSIRPHLRTFQPIDVPGCQLWLDAADQSSMTLSGSNVTQIRDKSSNAYTFTGSAGTYPTRTATLNGLPVISSAAGQFLQNTSFNQNFTTASCFIVMRPTEDITPNGKFSNGYPLYSLFTGTGSGAFQYAINYANQTQNPGDNTRFTVSINKSGSGLLYGELGGSSVSTYNPVNTTLLMSGVLSGSSATNSMFLNGSSLSLNVNNSGTFPLISSLTMYCFGLPSGQSFGYNFAEALIYGTVLTTSQRQQVEGYLAHKWGLTTPIPSPHPFKSFPPASLPFSPRNISGLALWLDAADTSTLTVSGSNVSSWRDKSGNNNNATQPTLANQPTTGTLLNGLNVLDFTGTQPFFSFPTISFTNITVFTIFRNTTLRAYCSPLFIGPFFFFYTNGAGNNLYGTGRLGVNDEGVISQAAAGITTTNYLLYSLNLTVGATDIVNFYINGANAANFNGAASGGRSYYQVGSTDGVGATTGFTAEILVYNGVLNNSQRQQIEGYLAQKWGLTTSLPATHPYKKLPA